MNSVASVVRASDGSAAPKVHVPFVDAWGTVHESKMIPVAGSVYTTAVGDCAHAVSRTVCSQQGLGRIHQLQDDNHLHGTAARAKRETRLKIPMVPVNARVGRQVLFDNIATS